MKTCLRQFNIIFFFKECGSPLDYDDYELRSCRPSLPPHKHCEYRCKENPQLYPDAVAECNVKTGTWEFQKISTSCPKSMKL